jgi:hypothetical protein
VADFEVTAPNGKKFVVTAPQGASQDDVLAYAQQQFVAVNGSDSNAKYRAMQVLEPVDPTDGMSFMDKFNSGIGKAFVDVGRGASQLVGKGPSPQEMRDIKDLESPLMKTVAGTAGNITGNVALIAPASLVPGAASVPAAGAIGSTLAALQPTESTNERLVNMGVGFGLGSGAQYAGTTGAKLLGERAARNEIAANVAKVQNAERDAALAAGRAEGLVVPPSTINPTLGNSMIESLGGKVGTQQQASVINQKGVDTLARRSMGLTADAPVTEKILQGMRKSEGQAYEVVKNFGAQYNVKLKADPEFVNATKAIGSDFSQAAAEFPNSTKNAAIEALNSDLQIGAWTPKGILEKVKMLRADASSNFKAFDDPAKLALARAQRQAAEALDGLVERNLVAAGKGNMAQDYRAARVNIAKLHDLESAFTPGGHFDARVISKIGERSPLSGDLKTIADFAGNFPKAVQTGERVGSPMVHALRPSIGSAAGAAIGGIPGAAIGAGAGVAVPWAARGAMLSGAGQRALATPSYSPGLLSGMNNAGLLPSPETAGLLSRTAIPSIYMGLNQ